MLDILASVSFRRDENGQYLLTIGLYNSTVPIGFIAAAFPKTQANFLYHYLHALALSHEAQMKVEPLYLGNLNFFPKDSPNDSAPLVIHFCSYDDPILYDFHIRLTHEQLKKLLADLAECLKEGVDEGHQEAS